MLRFRTSWVEVLLAEAVLLVLTAHASAGLPLVADAEGGRSTPANEIRDTATLLISAQS